MADKIKIDKGVPMLETRGRPLTYPWLSMEIGDSFFAQLSVAQRKGLSGQAARFDIKITTRTVTENGVKGYRVWRIA